uniref:Uncharacterized protein n=1 Tax=Oryza brachyantha TaxID=4533 RepID=J3MWF8_ORYBR
MRGTEDSADEPAAKRLAFDPDVEPTGPPEEKDVAASTRSPSPPPLRRLRRPAFKMGPRKSSNIDPTAPAISGDVQPQDQHATLRELQKANTGLQAECAKLLAAKAELEAERSQLLASKAVLEAECTRLKKAKDTTVAELMVALDVLEATALLAQGSSSVSIDRVVQQLEKMHAAHNVELRETAKLASSHALAIVKSLYPRVEVDAVCDGFIADCDETTAMKYVNEARKVVESVADDLGL